MSAKDAVSPFRQNRLRTSSVVETGPSRPKRRRYSRRKVFILCSGITVFGFLAFRGSEDAIASEEPMNSKAQEVVLVEEAIEEEIIEEEKEVPAVVDCKVYPYKHYSKFLKDELSVYKTRSLEAGIVPIKDDDAFNTYLSHDRSLVRVEADDAMYIAPMDFGKPYLTAPAHTALRSIARDFKDRIAHTDLAGARLKVTSLLRTSSDQRRLGRRNVNATRDADAPHTHGTSMDISYMRFISDTGEELQLSGCQQVFLAETLAEVITEHRKKDSLIFAIRERKQACYHLTVCR